MQCGYTVNRLMTNRTAMELRLAKRGERALPTELAKRLNNLIVEGSSAREIARGAGISNSTVGNILKGKKVDTGTLDKIAVYLHLHPIDVYQMAEILPPQNVPIEGLDTEQQRWIGHLYNIFSRLSITDQRRFFEVAIWLPQLSDKNQEVILAMIRTLRDQETKS